ncbi:MAG: hypothetical protein E7435_01490 [Ruminococcaceae bacterium]|nr:hypothetical protein [Oscillospiraceae bacterium]
MIYIPTLHSFAMNNVFTGSEGNLRFRIVPKVVKLPGSKEVDMENSSIEAEYWYGKLCYEKSTVEGKEIFPMSDAGRTALQEWLDGKQTLPFGEGGPRSGG